MEVWFWFTWHWIFGFFSVFRPLGFDIVIGRYFRLWARFFNGDTHTLNKLLQLIIIVNLKHSKYYQKNRNWIWIPKWHELGGHVTAHGDLGGIFLSNHSRKFTVHGLHVIWIVQTDMTFDFESDPTPNSRKLFGILVRFLAKMAPFSHFKNRFIGENFKLKLKRDSWTVRHSTSS